MTTSRVNNTSLPVNYDLKVYKNQISSNFEYKFKGFMKQICTVGFKKMEFAKTSRLFPAITLTMVNKRIL